MDDFVLPSDASHDTFALPSDVQGAPKTSALEAGAAGALSGATAGWAEQGSAAGEASGLPKFMSPLVRAPVGAARLAYEHFMGIQGPARQEYDAAIQHLQDQTKQFKAEHPIAYGAGELGGAAGSMVAFGPERAAAGFLPRLGQAAGVGAGYGAASGASEGINKGIPGAVTGAVTGAAEGAIGGGGGEALGTGVGKLAGAAYDYLGRPIVQAIRGLVSPEAEPARRVAAAYAAGYPGVAAGRDLGMTPAEFGAARAAGEPVILGDIGGEPTRALLRSAANASPEGRATLNGVIQQRFAEQSDRAGSTIRSLVSGGANAAKTRAQLDAEYDAERVGAYGAAYAAGDKPIWSPELERLTSAPTVTNALRGAVSRWKDFQVRDGFGAMNPPVRVTPDGQLNFLPGKGLLPYPNLQLWDYALRNLSGMAAEAARTGNKTNASLYGGLAGQLKTALDKLVPEFADARGVAAQYFGGNNAIEAGQQFANSSLTNPKFSADKLRAVMGNMKPAEREMFQESYVDALAKKMESVSDRQDISGKLLNSPQARQRFAAIMGPHAADTMGAFINRETIYDAARKALGNSSTVRQMMEAGLAGGAGTYLFTGDPYRAVEAGISGAGAGLIGAKAGLAHGIVSQVGKTALGYVDRKTATRVAQLLASDDPTELMRGLRLASRNARIGNALRDMASRGTGLFGSVERPKFMPQLPSPATAQPDQQNVPGPVQQRKAGGRIDSHKGLATKHEANYRAGTARHHCGICTMFVKPSSCTQVRGHISPRALCDFYEPKGKGERIVNNKYDVVTGANSSKKPTGPIFIDRHIPEWSPKLRTRSGKRVRLWTYLSVHEDNEQKHMEAGDSYDQAHEKATKAERKKAEADGVDWKAYTEEVDNYLARVEHERVNRRPTVPLHVKPDAALKGEGHHHSSHKGS